MHVGNSATATTTSWLPPLPLAAFGLMAGVLRPLGRTLPRLPAGPGHPGRTAGPTFGILAVTFPNKRTRLPKVRPGC